MPSLSDWADAQRTFIKVEEGTPLTAKLVSYRFKENKFDSEKQTVEYKLELPNGQVKTWDNGSSNVAAQFAKVKNGDWVKITRSGSGQKTSYEITPVKEISILEETIEDITKE